MQQPFGKFLMFQNRLEKVYRHLSKQAKTQGVTCYRVYDHDLPEFPLLIEVYGDKLYVAEYKRRHDLSDDEYDDWWTGSKRIIAAVTGIPQEAIFQKMRKRKEDRLDQYQKTNETRLEFIVKESDLQFIVNLSDYLDTGLFLDHRLTRDRFRQEARGKRVLNLFCYTGSFSVYALNGGASKVTSVDLSKTYLAWAERNVMLNNETGGSHEVVHADVMEYLRSVPTNSFDLIMMDPPTFSNSKRMQSMLDLQRDHVGLINKCLQALAPNGVLYFSSNYRKFRLDQLQLTATSCKDITKATTPFDFAGKLHRQCFRLEK